MNNSIKKKAVRLSLDMYELAHSTKSKHFSFIFRRTTPVSIGWNRADKTHTLAGRFKYKYDSIHSELMAIFNLQLPVNELKNLTFVNVRLGMGSNKTVLLAKPCSTCNKMLKAFGVQKVWYSTDNGFKELSLS